MEISDEDVRKAVLDFYYKSNQDRPNIFHAPQFAATRLKIPWKRVVSAAQFLSDEHYLKRQKDKYGEKYRISSKGMNLFSPSEFIVRKPYSPITVNQSGGISVIGNESSIGTISNTTIQSFQEINKLVELLGTSVLSGEDKLQAIGEAEVLRAELTKPKPDKSAIKKSWEALKAGAELVNDSVEISQALVKIATLISPFIS